MLTRKRTPVEGRCCPEFLDKENSMFEAQLAEGPFRTIVELAAERGLCICSKTAIRWATAGRQGLRLPSVRIGRGRMTTAAAFGAWLAALAQGASPAARGREAIAPSRAEAVLRDRGLGR